MQTHRPLTKPTKQRKMLYQAPDHVRHKLLAAHLSPELRASHLIRSLPVRSGDTVRVMRGDHKSVEGKITRVDLKKYRIYVEGLTREKVDGTTIFVPIHPSKVLITRLNLDDKWRKEILDTKMKTKKEKRAEEKPKPEHAKKPEEKPAEVEETKKVVEEKPAEAAEEIKQIVEEKPAKKEKAPKKEISKAKKTAKKKTAEKAKTKTKAEETEKEEQPKKRKPRRTTKKTQKTVEEEG